MRNYFGYKIFDLNYHKNKDVCLNYDKLTDGKIGFVLLKNPQKCYEKISQFFNWMYENVCSF